MKRALLTLILLALAFFAGRALYRAMASDETKIGWLLAAEAVAFNDASVINVAPGFAADYRDDSAGIDIRMLRAGVLWVWQNRRDAAGRLACRIELPEGAGAIAVDGDSATASFPLRYCEGSGAEAKLAWGIQVEAKLQRRDGEWWIVRSSHQTTEGSAPKSLLR